MDMDTTHLASSQKLEDQYQEVLKFQGSLTPASQKQVLNSTAAVKADMYLWPIEDLRIRPGYNVRLRDDAHKAWVRKLADGMKEHGFKGEFPLTVIAGMDGKKPVAFVIGGHCRHEAILLANSEGAAVSEATVVFKSPDTSELDLTVDLYRSNDGKQLSPLEVAVLCQRLLGFGLSHKQIAKELTITAEYVGQLLLVVNSDKTIRDMVQSGEASVATALGAMRAHGEDAADVMQTALTEAKAQGKSKVTAKSLPAHGLKKAYKQQAPRMHIALGQIMESKALFEKLPKELREEIIEILSKIPSATE